MKIIFLNGPPRCGKDTVGRRIASILNTNGRNTIGHVFKFAEHLKLAAHYAYGLDEMAADSFEGAKDTPLPFFFGKTPREVYIALSETYFKRLHGPRVFGQLLLRELARFDGTMIGRDLVPIITDSGFLEEAQVLIDHYGTADACLVRITREGCDFSKDSRSYWDPPAGVRILTLANNGPLESVDVLARAVLDFAGVPA